MGRHGLKKRNWTWSNLLPTASAAWVNRVKPDETGMTQSRSRRYLWMPLGAAVWWTGLIRENQRHNVLSICFSTRRIPTSDGDGTKKSSDTIPGYYRYCPLSVYFFVLFRRFFVAFLQRQMVTLVAFCRLAEKRHRLHFIPKLLDTWPTVPSSIRFTLKRIPLRKPRSRNAFRAFVDFSLALSLLIKYCY